MRQLLNLLAKNPNAQAMTLTMRGNEPTIRLEGVIDRDVGLSAAALDEALAGVAAETVHLRINSPGGDIFEARAMMAVMASAPTRFVAHVDGLAASAATEIAMAADEVRMAEGSFFMIHQSWTLGVGNADEFDQLAALLRKVDASVAADYAKAAGRPVEEMAAMMAAETWFSAEEAVEIGFVSAVDPIVRDGPQARFNLDAYSRAPKALIETSAPTQADRARLVARLGLYERAA